MSKATDDLTKYLNRIPSREIKRYAPHEPLFQIGEKSDAVYYVVEGRVTITAVSEQGKEALIGIISPGHFVGHSCVLDRRPRTVTAAAMATPVKVIILKAIVVLGLLDKDKKFAQVFTLDLVHRLDQAEADLIDQIIFGKAKASRHIARALLQMADHDGIVGEITHSDLAKKIGMTRSRVGENMRQLRQRGLLDWYSHQPKTPAFIRINRSAMADFVLHGRPAARK